MIFFNEEIPDREVSRLSLEELDSYEMELKSVGESLEKEAGFVKKLVDDTRELVTPILEKEAKTAKARKVLVGKSVHSDEEKFAYEKLKISDNAQIDLAEARGFYKKKLQEITGARKLLTEADAQGKAAAAMSEGLSTFTLPTPSKKLGELNLEELKEYESEVTNAFQKKKTEVDTILDKSNGMLGELAPKQFAEVAQSTGELQTKFNTIGGDYSKKLTEVRDARVMILVSNAKLATSDPKAYIGQVQEAAGTMELSGKIKETYELNLKKAVLIPLETALNKTGNYYTFVGSSLNNLLERKRFFIGEIDKMNNLSSSEKETSENKNKLLEINETIKEIDTLINTESLLVTQLKEKANAVCNILPSSLTIGVKREIENAETVLLEVKNLLDNKIENRSEGALPNVSKKHTSFEEPPLKEIATKKKFASFDEPPDDIITIKTTKEQVSSQASETEEPKKSVSTKLSTLLKTAFNRKEPEKVAAVIDSVKSAAFVLDSLLNTKEGVMGNSESKEKTEKLKEIEGKIGKAEKELLKAQSNLDKAYKKLPSELKERADEAITASSNALQQKEILAERANDFGSATTYSEGWGITTHAKVPEPKTEAKQEAKTAEAKHAPKTSALAKPQAWFAAHLTTKGREQAKMQKAAVSNDNKNGNDSRPSISSP